MHADTMLGRHDARWSVLCTWRLTASMVNDADGVIHVNLTVKIVNYAVNRQSLVTITRYLRSLFTVPFLIDAVCAQHYWRRNLLSSPSIWHKLRRQRHLPLTPSSVRCTTLILLPPLSPILLPLQSPITLTLQSPILLPLQSPITLPLQSPILLPLQYVVECAAITRTLCSGWTALYTVTYTKCA